MSVSKARRLAFKAATDAAKHAGTQKGDTAATLTLAFAILELAHQMKRSADLTPLYGPPEEH